METPRLIEVTTPSPIPQADYLAYDPVSRWVVAWAIGRDAVLWRLGRFDAAGLWHTAADAPPLRLTDENVITSRRYAMVAHDNNIVVVYGGRGAPNDRYRLCLVRGSDDAAELSLVSECLLTAAIHPNASAIQTNIAPATGNILIWTCGSLSRNPGPGELEVYSPQLELLFSGHLAFQCEDSKEVIQPDHSVILDLDPLLSYVPRGLQPGGGRFTCLLKVSGRDKTWVVFEIVLPSFTCEEISSCVRGECVVPAYPVPTPPSTQPVLNGRWDLGAENFVVYRRRDARHALSLENRRTGAVMAGGLSLSKPHLVHRDIGMVHAPMWCLCDNVGVMFVLDQAIRLLVVRPVPWLPCRAHWVPEVAAAARALLGMHIYGGDGESFPRGGGDKLSQGEDGVDGDAGYLWGRLPLEVVDLVLQNLWDMTLQSLTAPW